MLIIIFSEYDRTVKLGLKSVKRPMIQFRTDKHGVVWAA